MKLAEKALCTSCGACASICPKQAIRIVPDEQGFNYPIIDESRCVGCGACSNVCPIIDDKYISLMNTSTEAYVLRHNDLDVIAESTSGGAFTAIVKAFLEEQPEYAVYGAAEQDNLKVAQTRITSLSELNILRKSKYVESYSGDIYKSVKQDLLSRKKVIYSGTPCQIAGLYSYLGKDYENLLTIEIVCHGVPTSLLLEKYIQYKEEKVGSKCYHIEYRSKKGSNWLNPKIRLEFENGKIYEQKSYAFDDEYMIAFCRFLSLRMNCSGCVFAKPDRIADFTIGDFWGIESSDIHMKYEDGISLLLANSCKARLLIPSITNDAETARVEYSFAQTHNQQLVSPAQADPKRDEFLSDLVHMPFADLRKKYLRPRNALMRFMSNTFSRETKAKIKRVFGLMSRGRLW